MQLICIHLSVLLLLPLGYIKEVGLWIEKNFCREISIKEEIIITRTYKVIKGFKKGRRRNVSLMFRWIFYGTLRRFYLLKGLLPSSLTSVCRRSLHRIYEANFILIPTIKLLVNLLLASYAPSMATPSPSPPIIIIIIRSILSPWLHHKIRIFPSTCSGMDLG